jgi:hypothetical protein
MRHRAKKAAHTRTVMLPQCFFEFVPTVNGKSPSCATLERMRVPVK